MLQGYRWSLPQGINWLWAAIGFYAIYIKVTGVIARLQADERHLSDIMDVPRPFTTVTVAFLVFMGLLGLPALFNFVDDWFVSIIGMMFTSGILIINLIERQDFVEGFYIWLLGHAIIGLSFMVSTLRLFLQPPPIRYAEFLKEAPPRGVHNLTLLDFGKKRAELLIELRKDATLSMAKGTRLLNKPPVRLLEDVSEDYARAFGQRLEELGANVEVAASLEP